MHHFIDYTNTTFKNIRVTSLAERKIRTNPDGTTRGVHYWNCICKCGNLFKRCATAIKYDKPCVSCALKRTQNYFDCSKTEYVQLKRIWVAMKDRCYNKNNPKYKNYGGRSISVCQEWKINFAIFGKWALTNGYNNNLTIDRIDVNGHYEPSNCRWATYKQQANNKRNNRLFEYNGEMLTASHIADITGNTYDHEYYKRKKLQR